jgi:hypothetical protein
MKTQEAIDALSTSRPTIRTMRNLMRSKPEAFQRVIQTLHDWVPIETQIRKDVIEAVVVLEDRLGAERSLSTVHRDRLFAHDYEHVRQAIDEHLKATQRGSAKNTRWGARGDALAEILGIATDLYGEIVGTRETIRDPSSDQIIGEQILPFKKPSDDESE